MTAPIELRWLVHGDGHEDDPIRAVLQFRRRDGQGVWLPWLDVPEVRWQDRDK